MGGISRVKKHKRNTFPSQSKGKVTEGHSTQRCSRIMWPTILGAVCSQESNGRRCGRTRSHR